MNKSVSGMKDNNRSVRDIEPNQKRQQPDGNSDHSGGSSGRPPRRSRDKRAATYGMWFIGIVVILLLFFLFSVVFAETTVTVTPRTAPISVNGSFAATSSGSGTSSPRNLSYTVISAEDTVRRTANSSGSEYREERARGEITIFNEYSDESINLVPETRFEGPDGNIYRTQKSVTVPGQTEGTPGQVTAEVVAAEAGESYNITDDVRFSVPGFDGTPQEGLVYAELRSPISGGIAKDVPIVSTSTQQQVAESASKTLRSQLAQDVNSKIPDSVVTYEDGQFYTTETNLDTQNESQAEVSVTGTLDIITFDTRELSLFLANNSGIEATADTNLEVRNLGSFEFDVMNKDTFTPGGEVPLEFQLSGESLIVWQYNKQALARDLQSIPRGQTSDVMSKYDSIQSATIDIRPFWKRQLPQDSSAIKIVTQLEADDSQQGE
jgi:hypothetical protein